MVSEVAPIVGPLLLIAATAAWLKYRAIMDTYRHPRPPRPDRRPPKGPPE